MIPGVAPIVVTGGEAGQREWFPVADLWLIIIRVSSALKTNDRLPGPSLMILIQSSEVGLDFYFRIFGCLSGGLEATAAKLPTPTTVRAIRIPGI